jgi:hypothetical protein
MTKAMMPIFPEEHKLINFLIYLIMNVDEGSFGVQRRMSLENSIKSRTIGLIISYTTG